MIISKTGPDAGCLPLQRLCQGQSESLPCHRPANLGEAGGTGAGCKFYRNLRPHQSHGLQKPDAAGGTHLGILYPFPVVHTAAKAAEQLYPEIQILHSVLAQRGRRFGGRNHKGTGRSRICHSAQRRIQLHPDEAFPYYFSRENPGQYGRYQKL